MSMAEANAKALAKITKRCHAARIKPTELCVLAGIARQTFWRAEREPEKATIETLRKLEKALDEVEAKAA